jgi:hypothetical protein
MTIEILPIGPPLIGSPRRGVPSATRGALFEKTAPLDPPEKLFIGVLVPWWLN